MGGEPTWVPPADVYRAQNQVIINVELPGVDDGGIAIDTAMDGGRCTLLVRGERAASPGECGALQLERSYGPFVREFVLPEGARPAERRVRCEDGVLRIEIPIG